MAKNPIRVVLLCERNGRKKVRTVRVWDRDQGAIRMFQQTYGPRPNRMKVYTRTGNWDLVTGLPTYLHTDTEELPC